MISSKRICVVAIMKNEEPFIDEWLVYHRMLGINHFFIYDDATDQPLECFLRYHDGYVTVINWYDIKDHFMGKNNQTKAYTHALENHIGEYEWVAFIDGDEFIVLPGWQNSVDEFLDEFKEAVSISLNWQVFGHNGFYDNPVGLITASLLRRMKKPSLQVKSITKTERIASIDSAHFCRLKSGVRVDLNHKRFLQDFYEGKTHRGYINHYQCRSFTNWMSRLQRGDVSTEQAVADDQRWRYEDELLLRKFVESVALDKNEYVDLHMLNFKDEIEKQLKALRPRFSK